MSNKKIKKIIVNTLSITRIIGSIFIPLFFHIFDLSALIILLIVLFLTDSLDGFLARRWQVQTRGGMLLDPLGDKLLAITCIISFIYKHLILIPMLILEIATTILNITRTMHGEKSKTIIIGKVKMWFISINLVFCAINILKPDLLSIMKIYITDNIILYFSILTIILQIITIGYYYKDSIIQKDRRINKIPKLKNIKQIIKRLFDEEMFVIDYNKSLIDIIKEEN